MSVSLTSCEVPQLFEDCSQELEFIGIAQCESVIEAGLDPSTSSTTMHTQTKTVEYDGLALIQDIQEYKQLLWSVKDENNTLKVRLRRMESILKKKNKIVDTHYLGSHNKLLYQEAVHQFTQRFEILQQENADLKDELMDRDATIRKLRKQLSTYAAYRPASQKSSCSRNTKTPGGSISISNGSRTSRATVRSMCCKDVNSDSEDSDRKETYSARLSKLPKETASALLSKLQLKEISISNNNIDLMSFDESITHAPVAHEAGEEHDTDRAVSCSLLLDTPHEEIEKLHSGFKDIISEVGKLKQSVGEINEKQARTASDMRLRERDLMARLYDKQHELAYRNLQQAPGPRRQAPSVGSASDQERGQRRAGSAFARMPARSAAKSQQGPAPKRKGKKYDSFAIRTASKSSLHDEIDVRLYIDEVLHEMNRSDSK